MLLLTCSVSEDSSSCLSFLLFLRRILIFEILQSIARKDHLNRYFNNLMIYFMDAEQQMRIKNKLSIIVWGQLQRCLICFCSSFSGSPGHLKRTYFNLPSVIHSVFFIVFFFSFSIGSLV